MLLYNRLERSVTNTKKDSIVVRDVIKCSASIVIVSC